MLRIVILAALLTCLSIGRLLAAEPDVASSAPVENTPDEPLAENFSMASATAFLDSAALNWTKTRQCFTCHTNYAYLIARPSVGSDVPAHGEIRAALEKMVEERWPSDGPRWDAEVVMSAAVLAMNDAATTGQLHPTTRKALTRMWSV
jgi:squalene-hopene/tetraprenyl-beta-curcumene cyclase